MFGLFGNKEKFVEDIMNDIKKAGIVNPIEVPTQDKTAYEIGITEQGKITLTIGMSGYRNTLSMTDEGCQQLIRMLQSALTDRGTDA